MGLVRIHTSYHQAEMAVLRSELEAAGIYSHVQSGDHGNMWGSVALGGLHLYINEEDVEAAKKFIIAREAITDFDPIEEHKWGRWKSATIFGLAMGVCVPFYYLKTSTQIIVMAVMALVAFGLLKLTNAYPDLMFRPFLIYILVIGFIFNFLNLIIIPIIWHARWQKHKQKTLKNEKATI